MKFQRTPLILLLIALGLGGFVYFSEFKQSPPPETAQPQQPIFGFQEADIQALTIQSTRNTLSLEKGAPTPTPSPSAKQTPIDPKGANAPADKPTAPATTGSPADKSPEPKKSPEPPSVWQITSPEKAPANDGQVSFLLNLLATRKSDRSLTVPSSRLAEFGLDKPTATITVKLGNQKTHTLRIGLPNFDRKSVYAQADPPASGTQDITVLLVPFEFYQAIDRPLSDWQRVPEKPVTPTTPPTANPESAPAQSPSSAPEPPTP
jgi:Domain of unknown function (DUF4340)